MPDDITGWPDDNPRVGIDLGSGDACNGYLFNRSHLIAKSLGGGDVPENMVTGTCTENVGRNQPSGGMAYAETLARDWFDGTPTEPFSTWRPRLHGRRTAVPHRDRRHPHVRRDDRRACDRVRHGERVTTSTTRTAACCKASIRALEPVLHQIPFAVHMDREKTRVLRQVDAPLICEIHISRHFRRIVDVHLAVIRVH